MKRVDHEACGEAREALKTWLDENGWSRNNLRDHLRASAGVVDRWINGQTRPGLDLVFEIEDLTGIPARKWATKAASVEDEGVNDDE